MQNKNIGFIGAGNMTRSIIGGLIKSGVPADSIIASNHTQPKLDELKSHFKINTTMDNQAALDWSDVIVLAVKPQIMSEVCRKLIINESNQQKLFISIAAGMPIRTLSTMLNNATNIIRTMPNTPSLLGLGMTGMYAPESISASYRDIAQSLMQSVGKIMWVSSEEDINGVIAAAGSSPAYFFAILEAMQKTTQELGFNAEQSRELVQQAMLGAANMVIQNPDLDLASLRAQVTSKGGATARAIEHMQSQQFSDIIHDAMFAAVDRAKEMETLLS